MLYKKNLALILAKTAIESKRFFSRSAIPKIKWEQGKRKKETHLSIPIEKVGLALNNSLT
jgi:hypothetical protein